MEVLRTRLRTIQRNVSAVSSLPELKGGKDPAGFLMLSLLAVVLSTGALASAVRSFYGQGAEGEFRNKAIPVSP